MAAAPRSPRAASRLTRAKPKTSADLVLAAKARIENLSVDEVESEVAEGAVLVDLREAEELVAMGKISGSLHIPRGMLEFRADPTSHYHDGALDPSKRIILHCAAGLRSALAAVALQEMGYEDVAHLESGFGGWRDAGKPVGGGPKPAVKTRAAKKTAAKGTVAKETVPPKKVATPKKVAASKKVATSKKAAARAPTAATPARPRPKRA